MKRILVSVAVASVALALGCSRLLEEEIPPEEQARTRCTRANAWGYEEGNDSSRVWINAESGATLRVCLCASDVDLEDYDVLDVLVKMYVAACEQRASDLGVSLVHRAEHPASSLPTCDDAAAELRAGEWLITHPEECAESSFPLE